MTRSTRFIAGCKVEPLEERRLLAVPAVLGGTDRMFAEFSDNWKFIRQDVTNAQLSSVSDSSWNTVNLPHTFNASDGANGGNDYYRGGTWYRKEFNVPAKWKGRRIYIDVGAASTQAKVYVNGNLAGEHEGAYSKFVRDITGYVTPGQKALIAIRVDNAYNADLPGYQGDFTLFGGLTREVNLFATSKLAINPDDFGSVGVQISQPSVNSSQATLHVSASVRNRDNKDVPYTLRTSIVDHRGNVVAQTATNFNSRRGKLNRVGQDVVVNNPRLWNGTADPYLYTAYVQVIIGGLVYDTLPQTIGIRSLQMDSTGFKLNGNYLDLKGVNLHDDKAGMGTAMTDADRDRDVKLLKEMGVNAVRFAHWQVDKDFYDEMDRAGFIVWTEIPLWRRITVSQAFTDNSVFQMRELIRQNFNHASIAFWGLYNELPNNGDVVSLLNTVQNVAKSEDGGRFTIGATEFDYPATINYIPDVITFNKYWGWYGNYNEDADTRLGRFAPWLQSQANSGIGDALAMGEFGAGANINHHVNDPRDGAPPSDPNQSQFHPEEYQSYYHETHWKAIQASSKPVFASFIWQFTDSANDNRNEGGTPGINNKGLVTYDRTTAKDAFYYYKAQWSDNVVLYLTSKRYTNRTDAQTTVKAYSNLGTNVELRVNGVSQGTRNDADKVLEWNITLQPGANTVQISTVKDSRTHTDSVVWYYDNGSPAMASAVMAEPAPAVAVPRRSNADDLFGGTTEIL